MILVTGGAGFIGSNFIHGWLAARTAEVVNFDKLTYAGNRGNLRPVEADPRYVFVQGDIGDLEVVSRVLAAHKPSAVVNFAAETHVDRSIHGPEDFIQTNIVGTFRLLEAVRAYWGDLAGEERSRFRFLHVSTDEVYGSLEPQEAAFHEKSAYAPNSPYAASKAAADHFVRAYHETFGLPVLITNCSNNYGPYQFPEKLIPLMLLNAVEGKPLPIYGDGGNVRDWLFVEDHCDGILLVLQRGRVGEKYNIGGHNERTNLQLVDRLCAVLEELLPAAQNPALVAKGVQRYEVLKSFVTDRPGHDRRYAIDATKIRQEIGWQPRHDFDAGIRRTVRWYLDHRDWCTAVTAGRYQRERLGLATDAATVR